MELRELIESVDIVEYISQFVELEEKGGEYWGISPFTDPPEKTPSFSVRREGNSFYDFSSGIGGNVFTFIKYYFHCSSAEAVNILKQYTGDGGEIVNPHEKLDATRVCMKFSKRKTPQKTSKGVVLPQDVMSKYEKRPDKLAVWEKEGISRATMDKFQVFYDAFSDRLVYPIRSPTGEIVNIGGRTLDPDWKEKKLRKYTYFYPWGILNTIYGLAENLEEIKKRREIILFEGAKSVLVADGWGIHNTGAILTSHLNPNQMKLLAKLGFRVVFALDKEIDVKKDHNIQKLWQFVTIEYLSDRDNLLDAKDSPVDKGEDVFRSLYNHRKIYK